MNNKKLVAEEHSDEKGLPPRCDEHYARHPSNPDLVAVCVLPPHGPDVKHSNVLPKAGASGGTPTRVFSSEETAGRCKSCGKGDHICLYCGCKCAAMNTRPTASEKSRAPAECVRCGLTKRAAIAGVLCVPPHAGNHVFPSGKPDE